MKVWKSLSTHICADAEVSQKNRERLANWGRCWSPEAGWRIALGQAFTWLSGFPDDGSQPWVHTQMLACESLSSWDESVSVGHGNWLIEGLIEIDIFISDLEYKVEITLLEFIDGATSWEIAWSLSDKGRFFSVGPRAKLSDKDLWGYGDWAAHQWRCWRSLMSVVSKTFIL